jgi:hypothetical protein
MIFAPPLLYALTGATRPVAAGLGDAPPRQAVVSLTL